MYRQNILKTVHIPGVARELRYLFHGELQRSSRLFALGRGFSLVVQHVVSGTRSEQLASDFMGCEPLFAVVPGEQRVQRRGI